MSMYAFIDRYNELVGYGDIYTATRQAFNYKFIENRRLYVKVRGFLSESYHSYDKSFTDEEMERDAVRFLLTKCSDFSLICLKSID